MVYDIEKIRANLRIYIYLSDETITNILSMIENCYTYDEILDKTGVNRTMVKKVMKAAGVKKPKLKSKLVKEAHELVMSGMTITDACDTVGIGRKTYYLYY